MYKLANTNINEAEENGEKNTNVRERERKQ